MQGRSGQGGEPWKKASERKIAALNGTGKHPSVPQRPPGIPRVQQPPATPRVPRPQRQPTPPRSMRRRLFIIGSIFIACAVLACAGGYFFYNLVNALTTSAGAATTANNFLNALSNSDYDQAYKNLGPTITLNLSADEFKQKAQTDDHCYGTIKNYAEVPNSATSDGNNQSFTFTITRSKVTKPYQLRLTLHQDQNSASGWRIIDYGNNLSPSLSAPDCK